MADPTYYTGDAVNRSIQAKINGQPYDISSATIDVWNPSDTQVVTGAAMILAGSRATYQIGGSNTGNAGTYKVEFTVTFANSQGQLSFQETFSVAARYP
ncbi:MAG: hypothetical protein ACE5Q6_07920 [Dehalococcoidia bacterium]